MSTTPDITPTAGTCTYCGADDGEPCDVDCVARLEYEADAVVPTPSERAQGLYRRAKEAQDRLGWADPKDHMEVTHATVDLARVVTDLARELRQLITDGVAP